MEEEREKAVGGRDVCNVEWKVGGDRREVYAVGCDKSNSKLFIYKGELPRGICIYGAFSLHVGKRSRRKVS